MKEIKDWTIMVYMAGDNNLSENMAYSLQDLQTFGIGAGRDYRDKVNLLAFFDGSSLTAPTQYIDYSDGKADIHPIRQDDRVHPTDRDHAFLRGTDEHLASDGNSASAYSIMNFVHWCLKTKGREARNYALIFSAHSFGFHGTSLLRDESAGGFTTLFKLRWALEEIMHLYLKDQKISILGFDSCVMSMLEIGYELKDVAQTMVASEGSLPNSGWGYVSMMKEFVSVYRGEKTWADDNQFLEWTKTEDYVKKAAKGFVRAFISQQKDLLIGGRSVDISAWDLEKIEPVARNVNDLAKILNESLDLTKKVKNNKLTDQDIQIFHELKKVVLQSHFDSQTYMREQCIDLKDFCQRLIIECKFFGNGNDDSVFARLREKSKEIILAVDDCILKSGYSGDQYQFSNGVSLYFPWTYVTYFLTNYRYRYLLFIRGKRNYRVNEPKGIGAEWNKFLYNYLTRVTLRVARKDPSGSVSLMENFSENHPILSKDNPPWGKDNPPWGKDNPPWGKDNPPWGKDNPPWGKDNPPWGKGEVGEYLFYFSRFKNFQQQWDIWGYSDESAAQKSSEQADHQKA